MFKKNSVTFRWLVSYVAIIILTVALGSVVFIALEQDLGEEISAANQMRLHLIEKELDSNLELQKKIYIQIANFPEMEELTGARKLSREKQSSVANKIYKQCHSILVSNKSISEIFIYFNDLDIAVSSFGVSDTEILHNTVFQEPYAEVKDKVKQKYTGTFQTLYTDYGNQDKTSLNIAYTHSYPMAVSSPPKATVLVMANESYFAEKALALCSNESRISLRDEKDHIIFAVGDEADEKKSGVVVTEIPSTEAPWRCVIETPKKTYWNRVNRVRTVCVVMVFIILLGGVAVSVYLSLKNYSPLDKLIRQIGERSDKQIGADENEYAYLLGTLNDVLREKNSIESKAEKQVSQLREHFLVRMAQGEIKTFPDNFEKQLDIRFISDRFLLAAFVTDGAHRLFAEDKDLDEDKRRELVSLILRNIMGELIGQKHKAYFFHIADMELALVNLAPEAETDTAAEELAEVFVGAMTVIEENFDFTVQAALSDVHTGIISIAECYREAYETVEYMKLTGMSGTGIYAEVRAAIGTTYYYPIEKEIQLVNAIRMGAEDELKTVLNEIFTVNFQTNVIHSKLIQCLMFDIMSTILKVSGDIDELPENAVNTEEMSRVILNGDTKQARAYMTEAAETLCREVKKLHEQKKQSAGMHRGMKEAIVQYIEENYSKPDMNMQGIGDAFDISPYYLSRLFKNETGKSITDYVRDYRVEKARELLLQTDMKLSDIAVSVGFFDARPLTRAFKQMYGTTPGKYKEMQKKE